MNEEQAEEKELRPPPVPAERPAEPPKRSIRFEMCGSELNLAWQWEEAPAAPRPKPVDLKT